MFNTNKSYDCIDEWIVSNKNSPCFTSSFKILQLNIRSMNNLSKFDSLKEILQRCDQRVDVVVLGETWVQNDRACLFSIDGYKSIFSCRSEPNGGLAVFYRDDLDFDECCNSIQDGMHHIHLRLRRGKPLDLHAIYRPPSFEATRFISEIERILSCNNNGHDCVIVGDMNVAVNQQTVHTVKEYVQVLQSYNTHVTNNVVTRPASSNVLDHVICSGSLLDKVRNETIYHDLSDHCLVVSSFNLASGTERITLQKAIIDHRRLNELFHEFMVGLPRELSAEEKLTAVVANYNTIVRQCTKTVTAQAKTKGHCPWMTFDLWTIIRWKENLLKRRRKHPHDQEVADMLAHVSQMLQTKKDQSKREYYHQLLSKCSQKTSWKVIGDVLGKKGTSDKPTAVYANGGGITTDMKTVCNVFNEFFCNVGHDLANAIPSDRAISRFGTLTSQPRSMVLTPATYNEVVVLINQLDAKKCAGPDNIPASFVKTHFELFARLLVDTFNEIIQTGQYPECLKVARVVPIHKAGDKKDVNNYRPISTLSVLDKLIEKLIVCRIMKYAIRRKVLYTHQYGFRTGSSTLTATSDLVEEIYSTLDSKMLAATLFIDLKKAFDTIDHELLALKLEFYGIRGTPLALIKSYLRGRLQYVSIGEHTSERRPISIGVPQGSNLGPLLFLLFINDISKLKLNGKTRLFADDTSVFYRGKDCAELQHKIAEDITLLNAYFRSNVLSLNLGKTKFMIFHTPRRTIPDHPPLTVDGQTIEEVSSYPFLGLILDSTMGWKPHITALKSKLSSLCGIFWRIAAFIPYPQMKMLYFSLVHSRIQYLIANWGSACKTDLRGLQVLQNRCLKIISRKPALFPTTDLYSDMTDSVLPLKALYELQTTVQIRKYSTDATQHHNFKLQVRVSSRTTRQQGEFVLDRPYSEFGRKKFTYFGGKLYNALSRECKQSPTLAAFKRRLTIIIKQNIHQYV